MVIEYKTLYSRLQTMVEEGKFRHSKGTKKQIILLGLAGWYLNELEN